MKKGKVLVIMASHQGHYNASFSLCYSLERLGYEIIYAGENRFRNIVEFKGFTFVKFQFINTFHDYNRFTLNLLFKTFFSNLKDLITDLRYKVFKAEVSLLNNLTSSDNYDLILIDSFLYLHTYLLYKEREKVILLDTMLSRVKQDLIPPLSCRLHLFKSSFLAKLYIETQWALHFLKLQAFQALRNISYANQSHLILAKRYLLSESVKLNDITQKDRCFYSNLKDVKEIVLSPIKIDYPWRIKATNQHFYSAKRREDCFDTNIDPDFSRVFQLLKSKLSNPQIKIVYCSLGTIASIHSAKHEYFLKRF